jgi:hypothetical protein
MSARAWRACWLLWIASLAAWPPAIGVAAEPVGTAGAPIEIRRIYAPADRLKDWPFGPERYVPIDPADFERLWDAAQMAGLSAPGLSDARIAAARYQARLGDEPFLVGEAVMEVVHQGDTPVMVPLDPCGLTIGKAQWFERAEKTREAVVGLRPDGKLAALVERSGELHFPWSLRGRRGNSGSVDFSIQLPQCITNRLMLDLPGGLRPTVDHGIAGEAGEVGGGEGYRHWQIDCGGYSHVELRLLAAAAADAAPHPMLLRQSMVYDFSLRGVDVSMQVQLDVPERPLRQIFLTLDPELQFVSARMGSRAVPWSVAAPLQGGANRVVLEMPEPIQGSDQSLRLAALAPLSTDKPWRLPKIRIEGAFWQQGNATLLVPFPLLIEQINPQGCRQSATGALSGSRLGESVQLEYFSPDATVEVTLRQGQPRLQLTSGIMLEWGDAEIKAQMTADFRTADGESFAIEGNVSKEWIVDTVESTPGDALDDWSLEDSGVPSKLKITLAKAISPNRPVRIRITARRLYSHLGPKQHVGQKLGIEDLLPLHFVARGGSDQLVAIDVPGNYHLNITATELLHRLDPGSLDARQLELFPAPPRQVVFRENPGGGRVLISLEPRLPAFSATIRAEATLARDMFQESYSLRCVPESAAVDRVMVHFSRQRSVAPRWEMKNEPAGELTARALNAAEQLIAGVSPQEEAWEILLRRPRSEPFELHALRSFKFSDPEPVSLASLPEAAAQSGTLIIRAADSEPCDPHGGPSRALKINTRLTPIDVDPPPAGAWSAYRYNPGRDAVASREGPVTVSRTDEMVTQPLWAWSCRLQSRYQTDGSAEHLAVYRLQNVMRSQLRLTLPPGVSSDDVHNVWIDVTPTVWQRVACGQRNAISVDLPLGEKFPTVAISFTTAERRMGLVGSWEPPLPQCGDMPALVRNWTVWLPPGYDSVDLAAGSPAAALLPGLSQRLFGPLGRAPALDDGDPLAADTWALAIGERAARDSARRKAEAWLRAMGKLVAGDPAGEQAGSLTWRALLADVSLRQLSFTPLVDRYALAELGITPATAVRAERGETPWACGVSLLEHANLALLLSTKGVCLTTQTNAAAMQVWLSPLGHGPLWWVLPGPLADQLKDTAVLSGTALLVPIEAWKEQLSEPPLPWKEVRPGGDEASDTYGWHAYQLSIPNTPLRLHFVRTKTMLLWSWSIFLLIVGWGWWKAAQRPALVVFLLVTAAIVAVFVPLVCVPIASCAVLGLLFCLVLRLAFARRPARIPEPPRDRAFDLPSTVTRPAGIALATMIALAWQCGSALGQTSAVTQPPAARSSQSAAVYDIFIPSDDHQQPAGGKYYVPETFYRQLYERAGEATKEPHGWLINQAVYRGVLAWQASPERLAMTEMKVVFDLRVFGQVTRVRIPIQREGTNLAIDQVLLDGREVQPQWDSATGNPVILVAEPGPYRLELVLRPGLHTIGVQTGLDFAIPPLANSRLELAVPMGAPAIDIPSALGLIRREEETSRIVAALGPANRLTMNWQQGVHRSTAGTTVDVDELIWLKVRPGSVVLDAKFKFRVLEGHLRELQLAADPRLRLLPSKQSDWPIAEVRTVAGQPHTIHFELVRPVADQAVLEASFLLTGTSGVGNLRLPELEALGARLAKRSVAVSIDPSLDYQEQVPDHLERMTVSDFLADWGTVEIQPRFAFRPASEQSPWSLSTQPRKPHTLVDQVLAVSFTHGSAEVHYDAQLTTTAGYCFEYRLLTPDPLEIESVSLIEGGVERAARWSQDHGHVTVFLSGPVNGKQALALRGRLALPARKAIPLPLVRFDQEGQVQSSMIQLYRRPSVRLEVDHLHGLSQLDNGSIEPTKKDLGRLVKTFMADGKEPIRAMVSLKPNHPTVRSEQTIRLRANGSAWEVQTDFRIDVQDGLLDQIKITAPGPWDGPYQITPPESHKIVASPGDLRQLLIEPKSAISGRYQLSIAAPVAFAPGEPISVPDIRLPNTVVQKRLLLLPTQHEGQPIAWKPEKGLKQTELPADFRPLPAPGSVVAYQIWGEPFRATLHQLPQTETVEVRLADISLAWNSDDTCRGVAVFDFRPGRSPYLPISLPSGYRLIQVSVGGVSVMPEAASGPNTWRVPLSFGTLPQPVEVLFTGKGRGVKAGGRMRFEAPSPGKLPVAQTLWTIAGPPATESGLSGAVPLTPLARAAVRAKSLIELFDLGTAVTTGEAEDLLRWYRLWSRRLAAARAVVERELAYTRLGAAEEREATTAIVADLEALQQRQTQATGWLAATAPPAAATTSAHDEAGPVELWTGTADQRQSLQQCVFSGWADSITLLPSTPPATTVRDQLGLAAMLAGIGAVVLLALRHAGLCRWFRGQPQLLALTAGVAWWIWLLPAFVGPLVIVLTLAAWLIERRKSRCRETVVVGVPPS